MRAGVIGVWFLGFVWALGFGHWDLSLAYRPFGTEDAGVAGRGVFQTELSWDYLSWKSGTTERNLLLVPIYGVTENLEVSAEIPYLFHSLSDGAKHDGLGDINLVGKYFLSSEFTLKTAVKLDSGDSTLGLGSGDRDYSLFAVVSKMFGPAAFHCHLGYSLIGKAKNANLRDVPLYGLAMDYAHSPALHLLAEVNGNRHPDSTSNDDPRNYLIGVAYKLTEKLIWDFAFKGGLTAASPDQSLTTGMSATF